MGQMKRRLAGLLLAAATALSLTACANRTPPTFRIGVALYSGEDTFIASVGQKLEKLAKEEEQARGVKLNVTLSDGERSQSLQNEQVDRFLNQGYDVICVNIVDRTAAAVIVDKAEAAGVPVIFFNREPVREDLDRWEHAYYVGAEAAQAGRLQGQLVLEAWRSRQEMLDRSGDGKLQYVMLEGEPGHQDTLLRSEYCIKTLQTGGVPLERLGNYAANWQRGSANVRMSQWLSDFGDGIEAVFANNDDMALGAIDACLAAGIPPEELPLVVGVDATDAALDALAQDLLAGTVRNDAEGQAEEMMNLSCALLEGQSVGEAVKLEDEHYIWLSYTSVTRENATDLD